MKSTVGKHREMFAAVPLTFSSQDPTHGTMMLKLGVGLLHHRLKLDFNNNRNTRKPIN